MRWSRTLAAAALAFVLAVPATSQAISIVLTPACGGCAGVSTGTGDGAGATTTTSVVGVQAYDWYLGASEAYRPSPHVVLRLLDALTALVPRRG